MRTPSWPRSQEAGEWNKEGRKFVAPWTKSGTPNLFNFIPWACTGPLLQHFLREHCGLHCFCLKQGSFSTFSLKLGLKWERARLDWILRLFPVEVVRPWHRLPRAAVAALSLKVSKVRLDSGAWRNLVYWKAFLPMAGGVKRWSLRSFQPKTFLDFIITVDLDSVDRSPHCFWKLEMRSQMFQPIIALIR